MPVTDVEELIAKLEPEVSKIYFEAKAVLANAEDSTTEQFSVAARIVRAFWKSCAYKRFQIAGGCVQKIAYHRLNVT